MNLHLETLAVASVHFDKDNARRHNSENIEAIKRSLKRFGQRKPIVVDKDNVVIAGNGTLEAAKALKWKEIAAVRVPAEWTEQEIRAFAIADNRAGELAQWNPKVLNLQLESLYHEEFDLEDVGFSERDLMHIIKIAEAQTVGTTDADAEWVGMPEFNQQNRQSAFRTLIHFASEEDADNFFAAINRPKKAAFWYPHEDGLVGSNINEHYVSLNEPNVAKGE